MPEERKLVTILFADVSGWTALGEALDPEDVRALGDERHARQTPSTGNSPSGRPVSSPRNPTRLSKTNWTEY
jgi:hypothetical protein